MSHYKHFTLKERELLKHYLDIGKKQSEIAKILNRNKSSISREISRNTNRDGFYLPCDAQGYYKNRRSECHPKKKAENKKLFEKVENLFLNHQWSPEQISARLKAEKSDFNVSYTTIYRWIYAGMFKEPNLSHGNRGAIRKLRHRGKRRHTKNYEEKRGKIRISHLITERPKEANNRERIGDWEADTVIGKKGSACLVTLTDRKSRYLLCKKIEKKNSSMVKEAILELLKNEPTKTITPDRGKEFSKHEEITVELNAVEFYFPFAHHPWQRGTNENTNGLLREYFPKTKDIFQTDEYIESKMRELNLRPRKCLGWKTPYEIYHSTELHLT